MKYKKLLSGALGLLAVVSLAACGGGDSKAEAGADSAKDLAKEERVKKASIEVYVPKGKNTDYLQKSIELYNQKYDTELELNPVDVAPAIPMVQKVTPKLVANEKMPDLIFLQDSNAGSVFDKFEDLFYSSEDFGFVKEYGKDFYDAKMNMLGNIAPSKKVFGFPNDWGNACMFYNETAFKEAGIDVTTIKNWDELIDAGKKLKEKTGKKLLFMRDTGELDLVKYLTEQQGVSLFDKNGKLNLLDDAVKKSYEIIQKLQDEDLVAYGNSKDYTVIGQECGVIFAGGWLASYQATDYPDDAGNWRISAIPAVDESKNFSPMSGGSSYYVPKKSDNALAALQFITFALTDKDALDAYMELSGLPANVTAYQSEVAQKEFPYYGNQKILLTLDEISQNSIKGYAFPYSADLDNYIEAASYDIKNNGMSVDKALKKQAEDFASKYNVEINE
ncbi:MULTISPECIES: ABC transporter substrate-binding protein [Enterococcus]|uniref:ABC transporter substrate-binding protein n=1 Tax=Enterococcus thailandicus TaxID=417368 RepID=A0A179ETA8_ENTTH|nr:MULTISPECIES: extracellular solute-binding protein [Enterococcus]MDA3973857.1 extracellular solute-binding protein [Enterococcus thailandicus]MDA3976330.1 extracellular solute-binding protein [Enterococcus thailandicus]MDA3981295.1 extracellular solute-binding protein [Enterococcus thailandicus]OAQ56053.1 hypothetical protein A6E74_04860 [Enterococcus thailandicus]OTP23379.1 hypothetical protein A5800_001227 [Enterococcus sp. 5B7_DIV0075]